MSDVIGVDVIGVDVISALLGVPVEFSGPVLQTARLREQGSLIAIQTRLGPAWMTWYTDLLDAAFIKALSVAPPQFYPTPPACTARGTPDGG